MIWGLFSKPDYEFSRERMWTLVKSAIDKFYRAQSYLEKDRYSTIQIQSAKGAINKAYKELKEAMYNAEQAFKQAKDIEELEAVMEIRQVLTGSLYGNPIQFDHEHVNDAWVNYARDPWVKQLTELYNQYNQKLR
jgi:hypothetical protein